MHAYRHLLIRVEKIAVIDDHRHLQREPTIANKNIWLKILNIKHSNHNTRKYMPNANMR